jgi:hypothetical protein
MATNQDAFAKLEAAELAAVDAFNDATTDAARATFKAIRLAYDAEIDEMVTRELDKSTAAYTALTQQLKDAKAAIDEVVKNTKQFVAAADMIAKVAATFTKVAALL